MKRFFWFLASLIGALAQTYLQYKGILLGAIPTVIIWGIPTSVAYILCKNWDEYIIPKRAEKIGKTPFEYIEKDVPKDVLENCETMIGEAGKLRKYLDECAKSCMIKKSYIDIILYEYAWNRKKDTFFLKTEDGVQVDKICFCRKCGKFLLENSKFCRECGTEI